MIISHKHRYLFIEIPVTGSWAIHHELIQLYDGQEILHKHATYSEFAANATEDEKRYFVFATVRNPLDAMVSGYYKLANDHMGVFSDSENTIKDHTIDYANKMAYERYKENAFTFESAVMDSRVWERPYVGMIDVSADDLDYVIRYENLQEDFANVLELIEVKQQRAVPAKNKTKGKNASWESMYTPAMIQKVKRIYGPHMKRWGYEFPPEWGGFEHSKADELGYRLSYMMKRVYLVHFKQKDNRVSNMVRYLNGVMKQRLYR